jgi:hypothetical protein
MNGKIGCRTRTMVVSAVTNSHFSWSARATYRPSYTPIRMVDEMSIARRRKGWNGKTCGGVVRISRNRARACPAGIRTCLSARVRAWAASTVKMSG